MIVGIFVISVIHFIEEDDSEYDDASHSDAGQAGNLVPRPPAAPRVSSQQGGEVGQMRACAHGVVGDAERVVDAASRARPDHLAIGRLLLVKELTRDLAGTRAVRR